MTTLFMCRVMHGLLVCNKVYLQACTVTPYVLLLVKRVALLWRKFLRSSLMP